MKYPDWVTGDYPMCRIRIAVMLPLCMSACVTPPNPAQYSLDEVIASTIKNVRKGMAVGTADTPDPKTGTIYNPVGMPICSVTETWAVVGVNTGSQSAAGTVGPGPSVPLGIMLAASSSSTRSASNTVVLTWTSPYCSTGSGVGSSSAGAASAKASPSDTSSPHRRFVRVAEECPSGTQAGPPIAKTINNKDVPGYECFPGRLLMEVMPNMRKIDYPP